MLNVKIILIVKYVLIVIISTTITLLASVVLENVSNAKNKTFQIVIFVFGHVQIYHYVIPVKMVILNILLNGHYAIDVTTGVLNAMILIHVLSVVKIIFF